MKLVVVLVVQNFHRGLRDRGAIEEICGSKALKEPAREIRPVLSHQVAPHPGSVNPRLSVGYRAVFGLGYRIPHGDMRITGSVKWRAMMPGIRERFAEVIQYSEAERASGKPSKLVQAMDALDTESFRELCGLCIFGREYEITDGDPRQFLERCIQNVVISPREDQSGYLEDKPIGEYLRRAESLIEMEAHF